MDGFLSGHDHDIRMSFIHPVELQVRPPRKDMDERGRSCSAGISKFTADPRVLGHKTRLTKFSKTNFGLVAVGSQISPPKGRDGFKRPDYDSARFSIYRSRDCQRDCSFESQTFGKLRENEKSEGVLKD